GNRPGIVGGGQLADQVKHCSRGKNRPFCCFMWHWNPANEGFLEAGGRKSPRPLRGRPPLLRGRWNWICAGDLFCKKGQWNGICVDDLFCKKGVVGKWMLISALALF